MAVSMDQVVVDLQYKSEGVISRDEFPDPGPAVGTEVEAWVVALENADGQVVLSIREQPYVEAAISVGSPLPKILFKHILPNTVAPLIVQATYVCASAVIVEALLSFLGAGTPPEIPSWGNMMAEARVYFQIKPWLLFFPGVCLAAMVLTVNVLGDGLRDTLDPRIARRMK